MRVSELGFLSYFKVQMYIYKCFKTFEPEASVVTDSSWEPGPGFAEVASL